MKTKTVKKKTVSRETEQLLIIGKAFRDQRLSMELNLTQLEEKCGVTSLTLSLMERGRLKNASLITLGKIAGALGMQINVTATLKK